MIAVIACLGLLPAAEGLCKVETAKKVGSLSQSECVALLLKNEPNEQKLQDVLASLNFNLFQVPEQDPAAASRWNSNMLRALKEAPIPNNSRRVSAIDRSKAQEIYEAMLDHPISSLSPSISRGYDPNGSAGYCYGRALAVHLEANALGIDQSSIRKLFAIGNFVSPGNEWKFHVATTIRSVDGGWWVVDPIFERPLTPDEWRQRMNGFDQSKNMLLFSTDASRWYPHTSGKNYPGMVERDRYFEDLLKLYLLRNQEPLSGQRLLPLPSRDGDSLDPRSSPRISSSYANRFQAAKRLLELKSDSEKLQFLADSMLLRGRKSNLEVRAQEIAGALYARYSSGNDFVSLTAVEQAHLLSGWRSLAQHSGSLKWRALASELHDKLLRSSRPEVDRNRHRELRPEMLRHFTLVLRNAPSHLPDSVKAGVDALAPEERISVLLNANLLERNPKWGGFDNGIASESIKSLLDPQAFQRLSLDRQRHVLQAFERLARKAPSFLWRVKGAENYLALWEVAPAQLRRELIRPPSLRSEIEEVASQTLRGEDVMARRDMLDSMAKIFSSMDALRILANSGVFNRDFHGEVIWTDTKRLFAHDLDARFRDMAWRRAHPEVDEMLKRIRNDLREERSKKEVDDWLFPRKR